MTILKFLQQNAEWMCAIAIVIFTAVQCWLTYQQNMQNIRMKRLELANKLDEVAIQFHGEKGEADLVRTWLISNTSNFAFLLNKKDINRYKELSLFVYKYLLLDNLSYKDRLHAVMQFLNLVGELETVLGNANYGFVNTTNELEQGASNDR